MAGNPEPQQSSTGPRGRHGRHRKGKGRNTPGPDSAFPVTHPLPARPPSPKKFNSYQQTHNRPRTSVDRFREYQAWQEAVMNGTWVPGHGHFASSGAHYNLTHTDLQYSQAHFMTSVIPTQSSPFLSGNYNFLGTPFEALTPSPAMEAPVVPYDPSVRLPFEDRTQRFGPSNYGVIKIGNIPFGLSKEEVQQYIGKIVPADSLIQTHSMGYPVHIIMERSTGKTMDSFVEVRTRAIAETAINKVSNAQDIRQPRLGQRQINIDLSSQAELMRELFPRARNIEWREDGMPHLKPEEQQDVSQSDEHATEFACKEVFKGFVTQEEMTSLVRHAETPQRSPFTLRALQRVYECMISTLYKFPWYARELYTLTTRDLIFGVYDRLLLILMEKNYPTDPNDPHHIRSRNREVGLDNKLLMDLIFAGMNCPGFSERQKARIVTCCCHLGAGINISILSHLWPFQALTIADLGLNDHEVASWFALMDYGLCAYSFNAKYNSEPVHIGDLVVATRDYSRVFFSATEKGMAASRKDFAEAECSLARHLISKGIELYHGNVHFSVSHMENITETIRMSMQAATEQAEEFSACRNREHVTITASIGDSPIYDTGYPIPYHYQGGYTGHISATRGQHNQFYNGSRVLLPQGTRGYVPGTHNSLVTPKISNYSWEGPLRVSSNHQHSQNLATKGPSHNKIVPEQVEDVFTEQFRAIGRAQGCARPVSNPEYTPESSEHDGIEGPTALDRNIDRLVKNLSGSSAQGFAPNTTNNLFDPEVSPFAPRVSSGSGSLISTASRGDGRVSTARHRAASGTGPVAATAIMDDGLSEEMVKGKDLASEHTPPRHRISHAIPVVDPNVTADVTTTVTREADDLGVVWNPVSSASIIPATAVTTMPPPPSTFSRARGHGRSKSSYTVDAGEDGGFAPPEPLRRGTASAPVTPAKHYATPARVDLSGAMRTSALLTAVVGTGPGPTSNVRSPPTYVPGMAGTEQLVDTVDSSPDLQCVEPRSDSHAGGFRRASVGTGSGGAGVSLGRPTPTTPPRCTYMLRSPYSSPRAAGLHRRPTVTRKVSIGQTIDEEDD